MRLARAAAGRSGAGAVAVGSVLALTLLSGVAVAANGALEAPPQPTRTALTTAEAAVPPSPLARPLDSAAAQAATPVAAPVAAAPAVAPLADLRVPDLVVTLPAPLTLEQAGALSALEGVQAVTAVDAGTVTVGGSPAKVLGVDPSEFRAFTPQETAASDALWTAVARGELAPSYGLVQDRALELGSTVLVDGASDVSARIGAVAAYGLPDVDLVVDRATAQRLGVAPSGAVVLSAPERSVKSLTEAVQAALGQGAQVQVLRPEVVAPRRGGPTTYRELYIDSARYCPGLSWTVLAAIGQVESAHGKHLGPSSAGALGPMQFLPSTWAAYGIDGDGDGDADIMDPRDAVPSAAGYLCRFGAKRGPDGLYDAIFAYNHADWYVKKVLGIAAQYS